MSFYMNLIQIFTDMKNEGIPKDQADSLLEFDSDEYPDPAVIKQALNKVYGE